VLMILLGPNMSPAFGKHKYQDRSINLAFQIAYCVAEDQVAPARADIKMNTTGGGWAPYTMDDGRWAMGDEPKMANILLTRSILSRFVARTGTKPPESG
jgi:hypothetical protein